MIELIDIGNNLLCMRLSESQIDFIRSHIVKLFAEYESVDRIDHKLLRIAGNEFTFDFDGIDYFIVSISPDGNYVLRDLFIRISEEKSL